MAFTEKEEMQLPTQGKRCEAEAAAATNKHKTYYGNSCYKVLNSSIQRERD